MSKPASRTRIWEIDFLRGLSIILMVGYHLLYDVGDFIGLKTFLGFSTDLSTLPWLVAQNFFAGLFVVLSGISSTFSRNNLHRFAKFGAVALLITAVTYVFDSSSAIYFGIIHCLAVSILIFILAFQKRKPASRAIWGSLIVITGFFMPALRKALTVKTSWLIPLGLFSPSFASLDYFPLIPWFGIFLLGTALGQWLYGSQKSLISQRLPETFINWCGRHSLLIYLIHQPIIIGFFYLLGYVTF
ncbi:MAG: heparan-alpha-glucosaminide N-acetyltransferase [Acidobacteriota bacterium]|nr:heparan-alpha-glucosaminide N-acetyltransferase [Acidobacteriota bacterium]